MPYTIINKNLEKLDKAIKTFPKILGKYQKSTDAAERTKIGALASKLGLDMYIQFIKWVDLNKTLGNKIVYNYEISFGLLKTALIEGCIDTEVKDIIDKKTPKTFATFLNSRDFSKFSGYRFRRQKHRYRNNFSQSESILINYIIQNEIKFDNSYVNGISLHYYKNELPNFESEINTEINVTNDIVKSVLRKIKTIKYDFRKLNFNLLRSEIESKIRDRMLSVDSGEQIKCIEEQPGLTLDKLYKVDNYQIGNNGNLLVTIINDSNRGCQYNYRLFESISNLRDKSIDDILNLIYEE